MVLIRFKVSIFTNTMLPMWHMTREEKSCEIQNYKLMSKISRFIWISWWLVLN